MHEKLLCINNKVSHNRRIDYTKNYPSPVDNMFYFGETKITKNTRIVDDKKN
jgi:hypothetical protein